MVLNINNCYQLVNKKLTIIIIAHRITTLQNCDKIIEIENGEISFPINEVTIAGNLKDMFNRMIVANDLEFKYSLNSPTILIEGMIIAGV